MPKRRQPYRNDLGSIFAASVSTALGVGFCCVLFAVGSPASSLWNLWLIVAAGALLLATLVAFTWRNSGIGLDFWHTVFRARAEDARGLDYTPRKVDTSDNSTPGGQRPITADEVREIKLMSVNTWVPARDRKKRNDDEYLD